MTASSGAKIACLHASLCGHQLWATAFFSVICGVTVLGMIFSPDLEKRLIGDMQARNIDLTTSAGWSKLLGKDGNGWEKLE